MAARRHSRVPDFNKPRELLTGQQLTLALIQEAKERRERKERGEDEPEPKHEQTGGAPPAGPEQPAPPEQPPPPPSSRPELQQYLAQPPPPLVQPRDSGAGATNLPAAPGGRMMTCVCPVGSGPGQAIPIANLDGTQLLVNVPAGIFPGMSFQVLIPYPKPKGEATGAQKAADEAAAAAKAAAAAAAAALAAGVDLDEGDLTEHQVKYKQTVREKQQQETLLQQKLRQQKVQQKAAPAPKPPAAIMPPIAKHKQQQKKQKKLSGKGVGVGGGSFLSAMKKQASKTGMAKMKAAGKVASGIDAATPAVQGVGRHHAGFGR
jgi:hypothetical protein